MNEKISGKSFQAIPLGKINKKRRSSFMKIVFKKAAMLSGIAIALNISLWGCSSDDEKTEETRLCQLPQGNCTELTFDKCTELGGTFVATCPVPGSSSSGPETPSSSGGAAQGSIKWDSDANGTLQVTNNTNKDIVLFKGQVPTNSNILGGVKALSGRDVDISNYVTDFEIGGYDVIRGVALDEYEANKTNLANAKIEYSAMFTYGRNAKYRVEISPKWTGDYYYRATNSKNVGIELRLGSPDGEKIGYLPALATGYKLYANSSDMQTVYPVYVYYDKTKQQITTFKPTSLAATQDIGPRPVTSNEVPTILFPAAGTSLDQLFNNINYPNAFVTVQNNSARGLRFQKMATYMLSQNGYDNANSGEKLTFDVTSSDAGTPIGLSCVFLGGSVFVPVHFAGETSQPTIKNGYDYTVIVTFNGGDPESASSYDAVITEGTKRDIKDLIQTM
jgi:hypothetical protein